MTDSPADPIRPLPDDASTLVRSIDHAARESPLDPKTVVASARGAGRELLRALARARGGWCGFSVTTLRPLAMRIALEPLAARSLRVLDEFEEEALVDEALDAALGGGAAAFAELADGVGFRRAVRSTVSALRLGGIEADHLTGSTVDDASRRTLVRAVLSGYERGLHERAAVDAAGVFELAALGLGRGALPPEGRLLLVPGLDRRGVRGRFIDALIEHGAELLETDPVPGVSVPAGVLWPVTLPPPPPAPEPDPGLDDLPLFRAASAIPRSRVRSVTFFRAAGVHEELREALRRVMASGRPWDEVEILTPDPMVYGPTLHTLASTLGIPVTFAVGLPVQGTRPGRAVEAYLEWIGEDFPAPVMRGLLQAGDLVAPGESPARSPWLARRLRELRVGWGRTRYLDLIGAALGRLEASGPEPRRRQSAEDAAAEHRRRLADYRRLRSLFARILEATPATPGRMDTRSPAVSPADVARGVHAFLTLVHVTDEVDLTARDRLLRRLDRIRATLVRPTTFRAAVGAVREHLDIKVPAPRAEGRAPWVSDGGGIHLSDLEHGGLAGRSLTFVVGLDAGRFPGIAAQDPILPDRARRALSGGGDALPTLDDRLSTARFQLRWTLARLRGDVVISHPSWEASEGRVLQPASAILEVARTAFDKPEMGYEALEERVGLPVSRIPRASPALDTDDVWLGAVGGGDHLLAAEAELRERHPALDEGLRAREALAAAAPTPYAGVLAPRTDPDPRGRSERVLSPSALEAAGACTLRFFYRNVLGLRPPEEPEFDLERWLPARDRGSLLHEVYQRAVDEARGRGGSFADPAFQDRARTILNEAAERARANLPPPSEAIYATELDDLEVDLRSFITLLAGDLDPDDVVATEYPLGGRDETVIVALPDGRPLRLVGRIDRIDRLPGGALRVVDYKTGSVWGYDKKSGVFRGGRRLQHLLYTEAVDADPALVGEVGSAEYHFPTVKGENEVADYSRGQLRGGLGLVALLLDQMAAGRYVPTEDPSDCTFCDFAAICRQGKRNESNRRVAWAQARLEGGDPVMEERRRVRGWEEEPA